MRYVNRLLAAIIALALAAGCAVLIVEIVAYLIGAGPVLISPTQISEWAAATTWRTTAVLIGGVIAAVVGLVLLIAEIRPSRAKRIPAAESPANVDSAYTTRSVATAAETAASAVDGVTSSHATVKGRTVKVTATAAATTSEAAAALTGPVTSSVQGQIDRLQLAQPPRVVVTTRARRS